jgi:hypothetical protein
MFGWFWKRREMRREQLFTRPRRTSEELDEHPGREFESSRPDQLPPDFLKASECLLKQSAS